MNSTRNLISTLRTYGLMTRKSKTGSAVLTLLAVALLAGCMTPLDILFPVSWLYTQTAKQGTVTAADVENQYIIKMTDASPTTVGFTNSPARDAASISTASFVSQWDSLFGSTPPNASVVFDESEDIYVFALTGPVFDPADRTLWYHAKLIPDGSAATPPEAFDFISVFIDSATAVSSTQSNMVANSISLALAYSASGTICLSYSALPSSRPQTYGQHVLLFSGSDVNVYDAVPLRQSPLTSNESAGYTIFPGLDSSNTQYTAAYASGSDQSTICATVTWDSAGNSGIATKTTVGIEVIGSNSIVVAYSTPPGNTPATNGNWVGLWRGAYDPNVPPLAKQNVPSDNNTGVVAITDLIIQLGQSYTIGYVMGGDASSLAATVTFEL